MIVETMLAIAAIAVAWTNIHARNVQLRDKKLLTDNLTMAEHVLDADTLSTDVLHQHNWSKPIQDILYASKVPWSYDKVVMNVSVCSKCKIVHRYIVSGMELARKKGLCAEEGLFHSGIKVMVMSCPFSDKRPCEWEDVDVTGEENGCIIP
jgi:hypothetical protein